MCGLLLFLDREMATYSYSADNGHTIERTFPMGKAPRRLKFKGRTYRRNYGGEWRPHRDGERSKLWPMRSDAFGVGIHQVEEAAAHMKKMGVPTEYDPATGEAIFRSRQHRKRALEVEEMFDRDAGYGDPTPP